LLLSTGCAINWHQKPDKFEVYPEVMKTFSSSVPITVITPKNNPEMIVENLNAVIGTKAIMHYDLDECYRIAESHIKETLVLNKVPVSNNSSKYIKFTITKIQWEAWGALVYINGCYMHVTVETSNGYKRSFIAQDQSATHLDRAVGGAISRAVEIMFQDSKIIEFIEKN